MTKSFSIELPYGPDPSGQDSGLLDNLNLKSIIRTVYRRFWLIVVCFLTIFGLVAYMTFSQTPIYRAQSVVQIDTTQQNVIDLGAIFSGMPGTTPALDTEVQVIGSRSLLTRVATRLKLDEDPEFNPALRPPKTGIVPSVRGFASSLFSSGGNDNIAADVLTPEERQRELMETVVSILSSKIVIQRVGVTFLITIDVYSESPETAARVANEISEQYRVQQLEDKFEATRRATEWLTERVEALRAEVQDKEQRVEAFRAQTGLLAARGETLTEQQIAYMTLQRGALEVELNRARSRYDNMRRQLAAGADIESISEVVTSGLITNLKNERAQINRRLADLETRLGPAHPELISARNESADIDRQINAEVTRITQSLENELRVAQAQIASIDNEIGRSTAQLRGNNINLVRLRELERDAETSRNLLEEFLQRAKQTREQDALIAADAKVLSHASVPRGPHSPNVPLNLAIGILLGGVLAGGLALLLEVFDTKLGSSEDVQKKLGVPTIGSIPLIRGMSVLGMAQRSPADFLVENPLSSYAESIRYLRAAIAFSDIDSGTKSVAITSSLPDEGKTNLSLSLGRMSAMSGSRTLVIDGDFRRRQLTQLAGLQPEAGFVEHLFGACELQDAIHKDDKSMLDILPLSLEGHTPHDVFGTRAYDELIARLETMYDLILIDTGPLLLMAEARVVAGKCDKTILAVGWRQTTSAAARQSVKLLQSFKADLLGVTLNMVDINRRRHNDDPGVSYRAYRKYYQMDTRQRLFRLPWATKRKRKSQDGPLSHTSVMPAPEPGRPAKSDARDQIAAE